VTYWLRRGELSLDTIDVHSELVDVLMLCHIRAASALRTTRLHVYDCAPSITVCEFDQHEDFPYTFLSNGKRCTPDSKWAFLTALAVWLQAQYDAHVHLTDNDVAEAVDRLRIECLQPIE